MAGRAWTPGYRKIPPGVKKSIGKHMLGLAVAWNITIRAFLGDENAPDSDLSDDSMAEPGGDVYLSILKNGKGQALELTALTVEELACLRKAINLAFDHAEPISAQRDKFAEEEAEDGNDIFYRRHRGSPKLSIFKRAGGEHAPSVPGGPQDVLAGDGSGPAGPGSPGDARLAVAEQQASDHRAEDNAPAPDHHEESGAGVQAQDS